MFSIFRFIIFLIMISIFVSSNQQRVFAECGAASLEADKQDRLKIDMAKNIIKTMVNYPDSLVFHDDKIKVFANVVRIKFTAFDENGDSETHTFDINLEKYVTN